MTRRLAILTPALVAALSACSPEAVPRATGDAPATFDEGASRLAVLERTARVAEAQALVAALRRSFPDDPRVGDLDAAATRLCALAAIADEMALALKGLASDNRALAAAARRRIEAAGAPGRAFLRGALGSTDDRQALEALRLLVAARDAASAMLVVARAAAGGSDGLTEMLGRSLDELAPAAGIDRVARAAYAAVKDDPRLERQALAGFLCRTYSGAAGGDVVRFNDILGDDEAFDRLARYVSGALYSGDERLSAWASEYSAAFGLMVKGLRGSYYGGMNFEQLLHEQLDATIDVPDRKFPYPDGRQDNISVRWTGFVKIPRAGTYTFFSASDDGQRLWVADRQLVDDWTGHGVVEKSGEIQLQEGVYPFKVEFMQGGGGASISVSWSGPGIAKQVIPAGAFLSVPWK